MKSLQIVVLGAFFITIQPLAIANAQESVVNTDFSSIYEIPLKSGETFNIPALYFGVPGEVEIFKDIDGGETNEVRAIISTPNAHVSQKEEIVGTNKQSKIDKKNFKKKTLKKTIQANSVFKERIVVVTAYSSTIDQTDSSPCITANGFNVCENNKENIIAANFLPFGTRVRLPDIYGEKVFTVQDRMHRRHSSRVDVWMKTRSKAKQFGVKRSAIEIVSGYIAMKQ